MNFDKLAVEKCEDIEQQLFDVEGRLNALKTKVDNYLPQPYVAPIDPNKLPEIEFEGLTEGQLYQSVDAIKLKIGESFLFRTSMIFNPVFFRADASTNVKLKVKYDGEFLVSTSAMKFKVELNNQLVVLENNAGEIGSFNIEFQTDILTSSADCGNKLVLSFLGTSTTQLLNLNYVEIIVEGTNVFFTTQVSDYFVNIINENYEITKIDENGYGYYLVEPTSTFTGPNNHTFLPTGYRSPYQEKSSAMMNFGSDYYPEYPYLLLYNFTGTFKIDSFSANPLIEKTRSNLKYNYFFTTSNNYYSNEGISIFSFELHVTLNTKKIYRHVIDKVTGSNGTNNATLPIEKDYANIAKLNYLFKNYSAGRNACVTTRSDGTNYFKSSFDYISVSSRYYLELGIGTNITANYIEPNNANKFEVYMNVYGTVVKKIVEKISNVWQIISETVVGNYKKFYKGVGESYFAITHQNNLEFYAS